MTTRKTKLDIAGAREGSPLHLPRIRPKRAPCATPHICQVQHTCACRADPMTAGPFLTGGYAALLFVVGCSSSISMGTDGAVEKDASLDARDERPGLGDHPDASGFDASTASDAPNYEPSPEAAPLPSTPACAMPPTRQRSPSAMRSRAPTAAAATPVHASLRRPNRCAERKARRARTAQRSARCTARRCRPRRSGAARSTARPTRAPASSAARAAAGR
jgi:hypothetical protein